MGLELQHECRQQTGWAGGRRLTLENPGLGAKGPLRALSRERSDCNPRGPFN